MKKLVLLVLAFATIANAANAQVIGVYCDKTTIAPGETTELRFVVENGPIQRFYYTDGTNQCLVTNSNIEGNVYTKTVQPLVSTRYTLIYVEPGSIDQNHNEVYIQVGNEPNEPLVVQTKFDLPESCFDTDGPISLKPLFWSNVPNYNDLVEFEGLGVDRDFFIPGQSGGPGTKQIKAYFFYNGTEQGIIREIRVIRYGTGVDEDSIQEASVYPNPTNGLLHLPDACEFVEIYSTTGLLLRKFDNMTTIDISDMSAGMYIVKLFTEEYQEPTIMKVIKQ